MKNMAYERQVNKGGCQWPHFQRCQDAWMTPVLHVTLRVVCLSETVCASELQLAILDSCRTNMLVCPLCLSVNSACVKSSRTSEVLTDLYLLSVGPMFIWYLSRGWFRVITHSWTAVNMKAGDNSETLECVHISLHDVMSQKTGIFIGAFVRTPNLT